MREMLNDWDGSTDDWLRRLREVCRARMLLSNGADRRALLRTFTRLHFQQDKHGISHPFRQGGDRLSRSDRDRSAAQARNPSPRSARNSEERMQKVVTTT